MLQAVPHHLSDFQWEVVLGGLMGDGALSPTRSGHGARFRWGHGAKQADYGDWKASLFANLDVSRSTNAKGAVFHDVQPLPELAELREAVYVGGKKVLSEDYLKASRRCPWPSGTWTTAASRSGPKGLQAAHRGRQRPVGDLRRGHGGRHPRRGCADYLADTWGIQAEARSSGARAEGGAARSRRTRRRSCTRSSPRSCIRRWQYKLLPKYRGRFAVEPVFAPVRDELVPMPITEIARQAADASRCTASTSRSRARTTTSSTG